MTRRAIVRQADVSRVVRGAIALEEDTVLSYLCSTPYVPTREKGVNPLDPALELPLPDGLTPLLSPKDTAAPTLAEAAEQGLLPTYDACRAFYAALRQF